MLTSSSAGFNDASGKEKEGRLLSFLPSLCPCFLPLQRWTVSDLLVSPLCVNDAFKGVGSCWSPLIFTSSSRSISPSTHTSSLHLKPNTPLSSLSISIHLSLSLSLSLSLAPSRSLKLNPSLSLHLSVSSSIAPSAEVCHQIDSLCSECRPCCLSWTSA